MLRLLACCRRPVICCSDESWAQHGLHHRAKDGANMCGIVITNLVPNNWLLPVGAQTRARCRRHYTSWWAVTGA